MAHVTEDRVLETSTTTGTGALTLAGALTGYRTWASVMAVNDTAWYYIEAVDASGNATGDYEEGLGTYSAASQLTRTTVFRSSNANAAVAFAAVTKRVGITLIGQRTLQLDAGLACSLPAVAAEPSVPSAGNLKLYARELVPGQTVLKVMRPSGVDSPLQDDISFNRVLKWQANGTVMIGLNAAVLTVSAAGTAVVPASGTAKSQIARIQYATAATAGALHTIISPTDGNAHHLRGNVNGEGGFRHVWRIALNTLVAGNRGFWGSAATRTAATNVDPLTVAAPARVGIGFNANTGNWFLCRSDGTTAANIDLGATIPLNTTDLIELVLFCRPHNGASAGDIGYRVRRFNLPGVIAGEASGTLTTNIPAAATLLHPWAFVTNNATASAVNWHFGHAALQSDW
jgi:hypothetical protein